MSGCNVQNLKNTRKDLTFSTEVYITSTINVFIILLMCIRFLTLVSVFKFQSTMTKNNVFNQYFNFGIKYSINIVYLVQVVIAISFLCNCIMSSFVVTLQ